MSIESEVVGRLLGLNQKVARLETLETATGLHHTLVAQVSPTVDTIIVRVRLMPGTGRTYRIASWSLGSDAAGSITIDVWKDTHANYPPTNADSITNGHEMALVASNHGEDTDLSDWTTVAVNHGDWLFFYVDAVATLTTISIALELV